VPITLLPPDGVLEANENTVELSFDEIRGADVEIQKDKTHVVDQVVAYGARRTNTFTEKFGTGLFDGLQPGWTDEEKANYETAGSTHVNYPADTEIAARRRWHARARQQENASSVFRTWKLNPELQYPPGDTDDYRMFFGSVRLATRMPFADNVDYSGARISSGNTVWDAKARKGLRPPLVYIKSPTGKYVRLDRLGRNEKVEPESDADVRDWTATIRIPREGQEVVIDTQAAPQHVLAWNDFNPRTEDEDEHGHWQWKDAKATLTIYDERFAEGRYPADDSISETDAKRVLRIRAGNNYRLDYVAGLTTVDIDPDGNEIKTGLRGYVNDDRKLLQSVAQAAFQWYNRERNALRVKTPYVYAARQVRLGDFVTSVNQGIVHHEINAIITQYEVHATHAIGEDMPDELPPMQFLMHTAFGELDYLRLRAVGVKGRRKDKGQV